MKGNVNNEYEIQNAKVHERKSRAKRAKLINIPPALTNNITINKAHFSTPPIIKTYKKIQKETHMNAFHRQIDVIEELIVELDGVASVEEDHHLLVLVLLKECEQQQKSLL